MSNLSLLVRWMRFFFIWHFWDDDDDDLLFFIINGFGSVLLNTDYGMVGKGDFYALSYCKTVLLIISLELTVGDE